MRYKSSKESNSCLSDLWWSLSATMRHKRHTSSLSNALKLVGIPSVPQVRLTLAMVLLSHVHHASRTQRN